MLAACEFDRVTGDGGHRAYTQVWTALSVKP